LKTVNFIGNSELGIKLGLELYEINLVKNHKLFNTNSASLIISINDNREEIGISRKWGSQNGRLSWPCGTGGNFGFRGPIGLSGLEFFVSFWGNAKKNETG
jgi:hypothetical protein